MACACKARSDISYLQRRYGTSKRKEKISVKDNFWNIVGDILVKIISLLLMPLIVIHVLIMTVFSKNKVINVTDFIGLRKLKLQNVRN